MLVHAIVETDWGHAGVVLSEGGVCGVCLPELTLSAVRHWLKERWPESVPHRSWPSDVGDAIRAYFAGRRTEFECELDLSRVSEFDRVVLRACGRIGYGRRMTYGELAAAVGRPRAARAVGGAMSRNPVPLLVPCHRVVAADGSLCGFSASRGIAMKRRLLDWEASHIALKRRQG